MRLKIVLAGIALTYIPAFSSNYYPHTESDSVTSQAHELMELEVTGMSVSKNVSSSTPDYNLDAAQIKKMGVTDISDAIHRLPGVNLRDYGGAGGMKTVSVRGMGATHTGVLYDGVALSDCQNGKIDLSRYSLDNLAGISMAVGDRNEIFLPARSAAMAATLSLASADVPHGEDPRLHLTAQLRGGSFGTINPFIYIGKSITPAFSFSVTGEYTHAKNDYPFTLYNGKYETRERRENSMMNSGHGELNTVWRIAEGNELRAKLYYYDNDRQLPGAVKLYNIGNNETLRERNAFAQLSWQRLNLGRFSLRFTGKFNWDASLYKNVDAVYPGGVLSEDYFQRETYISGVALYKPLERLDFSYAADYAYNNLSSNVGLNQRPYRHSILQTVSARFRNSWLQAVAKLLCSVYDNGVKEGESAKDAEKFSPSVSLSVKPLRNSLLYLRVSYKNIFRMPTFNDTYYVHMGSTSLRPESCNQFNAGLTWQAPSGGVLSSFEATADFYVNNVRDMIVAVPQTMYLWNMTNLDKVKAYGVDLAMSISFHAGRGQDIFFAGNYSYQRVMPRTNPANPDYNKQVAYTPRHSGGLSLNYENPWVSASFHGTGASERYGVNSNPAVSRIAGYMEFGCALYHEFPLRRSSLELRGDLINMFDKQYEIVARYPMPGRSWRLTVTFRM